MEISNNKKKLTVSKSELESKISSKKDLHYILRQGCKSKLITCIGQILHSKYESVLDCIFKGCFMWKEESITSN